MTSWASRRKTPYTSLGIARLTCIRCDNQATSQWQVCADGNTFRPLCTSCDIELNRMVLNWMKHPNADKAIEQYEQRQL